jgi:PTH1 family peptidyl-tRNA hydrolase
MVGHVLGAFSAEEQPLVDEMIGRAADAAECWVLEGVAAAMNKFNRLEGQNDE